VESKELLYTSYRVQELERLLPEGLTGAELQQVEALTAAADGVALLLLEDHIDGCLNHAIQTGQGEPYVGEVMTVVRRALGRRAGGPKRSAE